MSASISIVIPAFITTADQARLLDETLGTVDAQTFPEYEVIVVDDGSPADVREVTAAHPRTIVIRQENAGSAMARNTGIARARGEFVVFLDGDDHLLPRALEAGASALQARSDCGFAVGPREEMTFEGEAVSWPIAPPPPDADIYHALLRFDWYIIPPSSAMFRREVVEAVGGFQDPWGADDLDFYLRVARRYRACCFQAPAITRYRRYSTSSSRDGERMLASVRTVYARQWPVVQDDPAGVAAYHRGLSQLTEIFLDCVVENIHDGLAAGDRARALRSARLLRGESPRRWAELLEATGTGAGSLARDVELETGLERRAAS